MTATVYASPGPAAGLARLVTNPITGNSYAFSGMGAAAVADADTPWFLTQGYTLTPSAGSGAVVYGPYVPDQDMSRVVTHPISGNSYVFNGAGAAVVTTSDLPWFLSQGYVQLPSGTVMQEPIAPGLAAPGVITNPSTGNSYAVNGRGIVVAQAADVSWLQSQGFAAIATGPTIPQVGGHNPDIFADFVGSGYLGGGAAQPDFATWLTAIGGTFSRASSATYVDGGIVKTAATNVPRIGASGIRLTGAQTELCLWNRDLTNAVWVATNVTVAKNQTGADGVANAASSLTATANNGTVAQSITRASAARVTGVWVKRISGSGTLSLAQDGVTFANITPASSTYQFFTIPSATLANPSIKFQLGTSGDAFAVDFVSHQEATFIGDVIPTTTVAVTQAADNLSFPYAQTTLSALVNTIGQANPSGNYVLLSSSPLAYLIFFPGTLQVGEFNGSASLLGPFAAGSLNGPHKSMAAGSPSGRSITLDGLTPISDASALVVSSPTTTLTVGQGAGVYTYGNFTQLALWNGLVASAAEMQSLTT